MARAIAKALALPRRLPLGCQRGSLYLPRRGAKKGRRSDGGISVELATTIEVEATLLCIYGSRAGPVAILGKRTAAPDAKSLILAFANGLARFSGNLDRSRRRSNNLQEQLQTAFPLTKVSSADVAIPNQKTSAAWQSPRRRLRNSKRWPATPAQPWAEGYAASMPDGNGARWLPPKQQ